MYSDMMRRASSYPESLTLWIHSVLRIEKKFKQKIAYADKLGIPYVIFLGEDEISSGVVACKDMATGEQTKLEPAATVYRIKAGLAEREKGTVIQE